jgi:phospholipase/carboxylesterase
MEHSTPVVRWRKAHGAAAGRPPLLVLFHGRGADEHDLFSLAPLIDRRFAIASLRAPLGTDEGGYTWSQSRSPGRYIGESLRSSMTQVQCWLESLDAGREDKQDIYLFGFSAGMAMASALVLDRPARYGGAVLLSGTLAFETDLPIVKDRLAAVNIFHGHGSFDLVIPADLVKRSAQYLRDSSGARLTTRDYPIAHEISEPEMVDINAWLSRLAL